MSVRIGLYEFFSYTVPGAIYLMIAAYTAVLFNFVQFELQDINDTSFFLALILAGIAYVVGLILYPVTGPWMRLFLPSDIQRFAYFRFSNRYSHFELNFQPEDAPILLDVVKLRSTDLGWDIERNNATSAMLAQISFGLFLLTLVNAIYCVVFTTVPILVWAALICLVFSIIAGRESAKYRRWFFMTSFESTVALGLEPGQLATRVESPDERLGGVKE